MEDVNKEIDKHDRRLEQIYKDINKAIEFRKDMPPGEKNPWVGLQYVRYYQEAVKFVVKHLPNCLGDFDLPFLTEDTVRYLPVDKLEEWQLKIPELRGRLENIREGKSID